MMRRLLLASATTAVCTVSALSAAQDADRSYFEQRVRAPRRALELTAGAGYSQGFGALRGASGNDLSDVSGTGVGFEAGVGYRLSPHWMIGTTANYGEYGSGLASSVRTLAPSIHATAHLAPYRRADPWIQVGGGYRLVWTNYARPGADLMTHGFQLAKAQVGVDFRLTPDLAVAPYVGADVNVMLFQVPETGAAVAIDDVRLSTFVVAGLKGRFDIAGTRERQAPPLAARR